MRQDRSVFLQQDALSDEEVTLLIHQPHDINIVKPVEQTNQSPTHSENSHPSNSIRQVGDSVSGSVMSWLLLGLSK